MLFLLFLIGCSSKGYLGPTLLERREAANQAAGNLNLDQKKAPHLIEAYVNNIRTAEVEVVNDFIIKIENETNIEDRLFLIFDFFENYKFEGKVYNLDINAKENLRDFLRGKIEVNSKKLILIINETLDNIKNKASELNNISKNFHTQIELIEKTFKIHNNFFQSTKNERIVVASNLIFGDSVKSNLISILISNDIDSKQLALLQREVSKILPISKNGRLR